MKPNDTQAWFKAVNELALQKVHRTWCNARNHMIEKLLARLLISKSNKLIGCWAQKTFWDTFRLKGFWGIIQMVKILEMDEFEKHWLEHIDVGRSSFWKLGFSSHVSLSFLLLAEFKETSNSP